MISNIKPYFERLGTRAGDVAVVSLAVTDVNGEATVVAGSMLIGPPELAEQSWPEWYQSNQNQIAPIVNLLTATSHPVASWVQFDHQVDEWRFLRFVVGLDRLLELLTSVVEDGMIDVPGGDGFRIAANQPGSLLRILSRETTSASRLIASAGRPVIGWVHRLNINDDQRPSLDEHLDLPQQWTVDGIQLQGGALFLAGFSSDVFARPSGDMGSSLRPGLVVGRMEHRAWIANTRGGPELQSFDIDIRYDPSQIAIWDLELDVEERDGDDLLSARRLRLGDVALPSFNESAMTVRLPTLGPRLSRRVRLFDRSGVLLDGSDTFVLVENIAVSAVVNENVEFTVVTGTGATATAASRLERLDRVDAEYADLLKGGLSGRIVIPGAQGRAHLERLLEAAHDELLIFDAYFGGKSNDWDVIRNLAIPIRIITGRDGARPPASTTLKTPNLQIRQWQGARHTPDFHDRAYIWESGGLIVGTSPSGLGNRLVLIDQVSPIVAQELRYHFEKWWTDPQYRTI